MSFPANYAANNRILASDYNSAVGNIPSNAAYPSAAAANLKVAALWGVGFGNYGYGQTSILLSPVTVGNKIASTQWTNLRNALFTMLQHYNGDASPNTILPPASFLATNQKITAHSGANPYDFNTAIAIINANRNSFINSIAELNSTTTTVSAHSVVRSGDWGLLGSGIQCEIDVDFSTENQARYFFNSGGSIRLTFFQPGTSAKSLDWNNIFTTKVGTFIFSANQCSWTGSWLGSPNTSGGYYSMTNSYATIFDGTNIGGSPYTVNDMYIDAVSSAGSTINGATGSRIRFRIRLIDQHFSYYDEAVSSGTTVTFGHRRATTYLTGIVVPAYTTVSGWITI